MPREQCLFGLGRAATDTGLTLPDMTLSYRDSGVDLELYEQAMGRIPALLARTNTPRVMPLPGGFAGLFKLQDAAHKYRDPVLVSGTDGVGTKIKVAHMAGVYDTIGIDLVAMCVNDCLCLGAEPLFFLDYVAMGKDNPDRLTAIVKGVTDGCVQAGTALLGGETAIMPDVYSVDDFDLAGFCVAVAEKDKLLTGASIRPGDVLIGVHSSGFHSNGYSLVRKAVFDAGKQKIDTHVPELGKTVAEALLTPTRIYASLTAGVVSKFVTGVDLMAIAHITGGGLGDNITRLLPEGCAIQIDRSTWTPNPVFGWVQGLGQIEREEMFRVFNMGLGMVFIVRKEATDRMLEHLRSVGETASVIGQVTAGEQNCQYVN